MRTCTPTRRRKLSSIGSKSCGAASSSCELSPQICLEYLSHRHILLRYDDDVPRVTMYRDHSYRPARFPTRNITTPITLLYGDRDSLVDINTMLKELPAHAIAYPVGVRSDHFCRWLTSFSQVPGHEHLGKHPRGEFGEYSLITLLCRRDLGLVRRHTRHSSGSRDTQST